MPQSLSNILIHLVFSTKNRIRLITPEIENELYPISRQFSDPSTVLH